MKLIDNARDWWKMASMRVALAWSAVFTVWPMLPEGQRSALLTFIGVPPQVLNGVMALIAFATLLGARVVKQKKL
jgi:hypothetical protein